MEMSQSCYSKPLPGLRWHWDKPIHRLHIASHQVQDVTSDSVAGLYLCPLVFIVTLDCISSYEDALITHLSCQPDIPVRGSRLRVCLLPVRLKMPVGHFLGC